MRSRQIAERLGVEEAHMLEFQQFNALWDKRMAEFEQKSADLEEAMKVTPTTRAVRPPQQLSDIRNCVASFFLPGATRHRADGVHPERAKRTSPQAQVRSSL